MSTFHIPNIIERSPRGERSYDIFSRLLLDRIVFLGSAVDDDVANILMGARSCSSYWASTQASRSSA
jgi:ATP-dependent Clp protease, protease subunit